MGYRFIVAAREGPIERLTLNRPDVRNAFNEQVIAELTEWAARTAAEPAATRPRVVVLRGAGKTFCAGADVVWMSKTVDYTEQENVDDATAMSRMFAALNAVPAAVIGRIHGAALGGGAGLAAICDIVVAAEGAVFGFTEVKLGIVPAVISPFVLPKIGASAARELFLTGARFSAARAREIGLVHAVVAEAELDRTVSRYAEEVLAAGPEAVGVAKALIPDVMGLPLDRATPLTAHTIAARRVSAEGQEGLRAFLEKRRARWIAAAPPDIKNTRDTKDAKRR
jgi:methylglutaconyl-CoA hydratase